MSFRYFMVLVVGTAQTRRNMKVGRQMGIT